MSSDALIRLDDVSVNYQRWGQTVAALTNISLSIYAKEWILVAGPNGSGKSTLLNIIGELKEVSSGTIRFATVNGSKPNGAPVRPFFIHQDPLRGTAPGLTVEENLMVAEPGRLGKKRARGEMYRKWLKPIGLDERLRQPVENLSGGERQLLALLIAQIRRASLILLDEPLSALDPARTELAKRQIADLHASGITVIQVTHDIGQLETFTGRLIGLKEGRLVYDSSRDQSVPKSLDWLWNARAHGR
jgi:ABC-type multidrug transport system ATPase subunit